MTEIKLLGEPMAGNEPSWHYCNGGESFSDGVNNYFSAWLELPGPDGTTTRHVVCRLIVPIPVAKQLAEQATKAMSGAKTPSH